MLSKYFYNIKPDLVDETSLASRLSVIFIYIGVYLKDAFSVWINPSFGMFFIAIGILLGTGVFFLNGSSNRRNRVAIIFVAVSVVVWVTGALLSASLQIGAYYISIFCAFIVVFTSPRLFLKLLLFHLFVSLGIQGLEYLTDKYLFVYESMDKGALDEKLFGGQFDIIRAKGLFQGPLSAVAFTYWIVFLSPRKILPVFMLFLTAFFAGGRLGISVSIVLLVVRIVLNDRSKLDIRILKKMSTIIGIIILLAVSIALFVGSSSERLGFIASAYDLNNPQNASRLISWALSIQSYLNYSALEMFVGNFGFAQNSLGSTENDFLRILLDHGMICLVLYILAISNVLFVAVRKRNFELFFMAMLIVVLMTVFPFIQSLSSAILFWVFVFMVSNFQFGRE